MKLLILLILLAVPVAAQAQSEQPKFKFKPSSTKIDALYFSALAGDIVTTEYALRHNPRAFERNPLLGGSSGQRIAVNAGLTTGTWLAAEYLEHRGKPKASKAIKIGMIIVRVAAAWNNARHF